jgi:hypothetical protein
VQPGGVDAERGDRVQQQPGQQRGPVGVEQPDQHPADPVVVEQSHFLGVQSQQSRLERRRPVGQRVHRLPVQHQVAHHHPDRGGRRQFQPPVVGGQVLLEQPVQAKPGQEVVDHRDRPQPLADELERT